MILAPHFLTGAVVAQRVQILPLALVLAFLSHYILDTIPHREYAERKETLENLKFHHFRALKKEALKVAIDLVLAFIIVLIFAKNYKLAITGGILGSLPDFFSFFTMIGISKNKILAKHHHYHLNKVHHFFNPVYKKLKIKKISIFWRVLSQTVVVLLAIFLL